MSTTIRLTPHGEALLQKQLANGSYRSPEEVVERALETLAENSEQLRVSASTMTSAEAVADIQANRKGVTLGGLKIRDLIHEGHRY
jgi:Arc/MetJ-type ribon-helix-helix transcriptional regulator